VGFGGQDAAEDGLHDITGGGVPAVVAEQGGCEGDQSRAPAGPQLRGRGFVATDGEEEQVVVAAWVHGYWAWAGAPLFFAGRGGGVSLVRMMVSSSAAMRSISFPCLSMARATCSTEGASTRAISPYWPSQTSMVSSWSRTAWLGFRQAAETASKYLPKRSRSAESCCSLSE